MLLDRYEITELISVGGMGLVYKAQHLPLGRSVAVKLIHPHLLSDEGVASRFLVEAQVASRLNHPNIVSIHDFGRTPQIEGGHFILVMELLSGPRLSTLLRTEAAMPIARIADILCQTLGALAEVHHHGVTHRDVKPSNILVESDRSGGDRIKLIDFGIARLGGGPRLTRAGQILGTPNYMAPEQMTGKSVGSSADLYSVGVLLFRMLTMQLPFTGETAEALMAKHTSAPRPDPRAVAPGRRIPDAVAQVCLKALAIDPADRYSSAEELARALYQAATDASWSARHRPLFRATGGSSAPPAPRAGHDSFRARSPSVRPSQGPPDRAELEEPTKLLPLFRSIVPPDLAAIESETRLVGRSADLAWAAECLHAASPHRAGFAIYGGAGMGRTSLLREIVALGLRRGAHGVFVASSPPPRNEVSYSGLRALITGVTGVPPWHPPLVSGKAASTPLEAEGLRMVFRRDLEPPPTGPRASRQAAAEALCWALSGAAKSVAPAPLLVAIDDLDRMDGVSRDALIQVLTTTRIEGLSVVLTAAVDPAPWFSGRVPSRAISGLSHDEAAELVGTGPEALLEPSILSFEPLYLEQLLHWVDEQGTEHAPPLSLNELVEARLSHLPVAPRRALQVVAVAGSGELSGLAALAPHPESFHEGVFALAMAGFVEVDGKRVTLSHSLFGELSRAMAPSGTIAEMHARAAEALLLSSGSIELRAHHAIHGEPDFEAFLLIERSAVLRELHGDTEGAMALLWEAMWAARAEVLRGDAEATSGWFFFGQKLGEALLQASRLEEAAAVLSEILELVSDRDVRRALLLEQLATIAERRGRFAEEQDFRAEALEVADALDEPGLVDRLRTRPPVSGAAPRESIPGSHRRLGRAFARADEVSTAGLKK